MEATITNIINQYNGNLVFTGFSSHGNEFATELVPLLKNKKVLYIRALKTVSNITDILKENSYWTVGLDGDSQTNICDYKVSPKTVIIMGAEGKGMRRLTKESCDEIVYIETPNSDEIVDSLNVSNAATIALFEISRKT